MKIQRNIRWYQKAFHEHLVGGGLRAIEIAHRRWGKDEISLAATCEIALKRPASYWHCLPEYGQGRKALWTAVNAHTGRRRIDEAFPDAIRENVNEQEMFIRLKNGSTWQIIGSDRFDQTVGAGVAGIVYSEWALANPDAWAYHRPMVSENNGFAAFITTPRGHNHAKAMLDNAQKNPKTWFAEVSGVQHTHAVNRETLLETLTEYCALYGEDAGRAKLEQEYFCSFNAAILGAFYGREIARLRSEDRITDEAVANPKKPVHRAWDLGMRDDTTVWFFQVQGGQPVILGVYSTNGVGLDHYAATIKRIYQEKGWFNASSHLPGQYQTEAAIDFVPHDARVRELGSGRSRIETMFTLGLNPQLVPNLAKIEGINAVRRTLSLAIFHPDCEEDGIRALELYQREWDSEKKMFKEREVHDWTSHYADAFRYLSLAWQTVPSQGIYSADGEELPVEDYSRAIDKPYYTASGWILPPPPGSF